MDYKYDVFISYSRRDYVDNGEVIPGNPISAIQDVLEKNKISFWIDKDGIYSGDEFIEVITDAIISSKMLIFVSSRHSNISEWTTGEILLAKKRKKAILPVRIDDSDYNPKFELVLLAHDFVNYYESEQESLAKILKAVKKNNEEFASQQVAVEIQELAKDCMVLLSQQEALVKSLVAKNLSIGITTKNCPVCGKPIPLEDTFCGRCGWHFSPLYALGGNSGSAGDKQHLSLARANWQKMSADAEDEAKAERLEEENQKLRTTLERLSAECKSLTEKLFRRDVDLQSSKAHAKDLRNQLNELQELKSRLSEDISAVQGKLSASEAERKVLQETLYQTQEELRKTKDELEAKKKEVFDLEKKNQELQGLKKKSSVSAVPSSVPSSSTSVSAAQLTFMVNGVSFKMICVEGSGTPYYIGETQVTQALWQAVMKNNPSNFKGGNLPVEKVSWDDCQLFIKELNEETGGLFRLPTEAEWMYAAKGGNKSHGYMYSGSNTIDEVAWYKRNSNGTTHPVKSKKPNELDIYDMSGNVWEWCEDSDGSDRVYRGGGWASNAPVCRVAYHNSYLPSTRGGNLGFRLAL